jgi:predicted phosphodiesterase
VEVVELAGHTFYMLHDANRLDLDPAAAGFAAVISGHSHKPLIAWRGKVLFFNPGSAGPRRFKLPVSVGWIEAAIEGEIEAGEDALIPSVVELKV